MKHRQVRTIKVGRLLIMVLAPLAFCSCSQHKSDSEPAPPLPAELKQIEVTDIDFEHIELDEVDVSVRSTIETAQQAIRQNRKSAAAWGYLAMLLLAYDLDAQLAQDCLVTAEHLDPTEPKWPYLAGYWLAERRATTAAVDKLRRATELDSGSNFAMRLKLVETLLALDELDAADAELQIVLQQSPGDVQAQLCQGRLAVRRERPADAVEPLLRASKDPRTRKAALTALSQAYQQLDDIDAARRTVNQAARLPADIPPRDRYLAEVLALRTGRRAILAQADGLLARNRPAEALAVLKKTLAEYPDLGWAWLLKGRAHLQLRHPSEAALSLRKSIELLPNSSESYFYLGVALLDQQQLEQATAAFGEAARLSPDFALAHYYHGTCLTRGDERNAAIEAFGAAVRAKPDLWQAHLDLAKLLIEQQAYEAAKPNVEAVLRADPTNVEGRSLQAKLDQISP